MAVKTGEFPDFGAIFMSNGRTRRECLQLQLFGLPLQFADFVKSIRAGMILFLFDHEKRNLHGVFEAISDGGYNIVPNAFHHSSGRAFPSQVQIRVLFNCYPLHEKCFRYAIEENYYAAYKFRFGLSREQVYRLLSMFDVRKIGPRRSLKQENVHSKSPGRESLSVVPGNQTAPEKTSQKFKSPDAQTSPVYDEEQQQEKIDEIDCPDGDSMDLGDYIPLWSPEDENEDEGDLDHKTCLKGLYSDIAATRASVFTRLELSLHESENLKTMEHNESVEKIMRNLEMKHDNWVKMRKRSETGTFQDINYPVPPKRSNVFSRLSFTSEAIGRWNIGANNSYSQQTFEVLSNRNKKRNHGMRFQENATAENDSKYRTTYGRNMTLSIAPSKWSRSREFERRVNNNNNDTVWQRRSVFSLLSFTSATTKTGQNSGFDKTMEDVFREKKKRKHVSVGVTEHHTNHCKNMSGKVNEPENILENGDASAVASPFYCAKRIVETTTTPTSVILEENKRSRSRSSSGEEDSTVVVIHRAAAAAAEKGGS